MLFTPFHPILVITEDAQVSVWVTIAGMIFTALVTFFSTKHSIRKDTQTKFDKVNKEVTELKLEMKELQKTDELQQMVIDNLNENVLKKLPPDLPEKLDSILGMTSDIHKNNSNKKKKG